MQAIFFTRKHKPCFTSKYTLRFGACDFLWNQLFVVKYLGAVQAPRPNFNFDTNYIIYKVKQYHQNFGSSNLNIDRKKLIIEILFPLLMFILIRFGPLLLIAVLNNYKLRKASS